MRNVRNLTERQRKVLDVITTFQGRNGYPPTIREIADLMGLRSPNGVSEHLKALNRKGYVRREENKSRGIQLVTSDYAGEDSRPPTTAITVVPLLGRVAAGEPIPAIESADEFLYVDNRFVGRHKQLFSLRIRGDSMINAGILDGDFVLVAPSIEARQGDIVVVRIDGEATCKYFHPDPAHDRVILKPANPNMADIIVSGRQFRETVLVGRVAAVLRRL